MLCTLAIGIWAGAKFPKAIPSQSERFQNGADGTGPGNSFCDIARGVSDANATSRFVPASAPIALKGKNEIKNLVKPQGVFESRRRADPSPEIDYFLRFDISDRKALWLHSKSPRNRRASCSQGLSYRVRPRIEKEHYGQVAPGVLSLETASSRNDLGKETIVSSVSGCRYIDEKIWGREMRKYTRDNSGDIILDKPSFHELSYGSAFANLGSDVRLVPQQL
ncbi:hypothetical protein BDP27DRAFT_1365001 [Rhodocollybia butyracea]|uniref:Uncharacterized protein n=1 Tax=Rhodocollybia butyracea TaxID=206335 RepID=A0A9P5PK88_9AGAR|nr:hypothetical protein BDP27DRAFT_1365001 [Rhodocollybia butyracea]